MERFVCEDFLIRYESLEREIDELTDVTDEEWSANTELRQQVKDCSET
jgi:hypothetical protein